MTKVIFRKWKNGAGIIALFPEIPEDSFGSFCTSYEHVGQHGGAYYEGCIRCSSPATVLEYAELFKELVKIGYADLVVISRAPPDHAYRRAQEAAKRLMDDENGEDNVK